MARNIGQTVQSFFSKGYLTEFTGLNFPEDATTASANVIYNRDGSVESRPGIDYEDSAVLNAVTQTDSAVSYYVWENVAGQGELTFLVVQHDNTIHFFEIDSDGLVSSNKKSFTVDISTHRPDTGVDAGEVKCQFASGNGDLFITHPNIEPLVIEYSVSGDSITTTEILIEIRDTQGIDDGLDIDERPTTLSTDHKYNLYNQGWNQDKMIIGVGAATNLLSRWDAIRTDFPSNAEQPQTYKYKVSGATLDYFDLAVNQSPEKYLVGNSLAPRGHHILGAFELDRDTASGLSGVTTTSTDIRPTAVAFFGGRVWYAGVNARGWSSKFYFTQVIEDESQYKSCHSFNDPTSEVLSDPLSTDGGIINIPEVGSVLKLLSIGNSLLVFASNGIWTISGTADSGFTATDFSVSKISNIGALGEQSIVNVKGQPYWWNRDAIYTLEEDAASGRLTAVSITEATIQTFFDSIPSDMKKYAAGAYNSLDNEIQWSYRATSQTDIDEYQAHDRILSLSLRDTHVWSPWTIDTTLVEIMGPFYSPLLSNSFKYIGIADSTGAKNVIVEANDETNWKDFYTRNSVGSDFTPSFTAGYTVGGGLLTKFQENYLRVFTATKTGTSLEVTGYWDYGNSSDSNKWSNSQQVYPSSPDTNFDVQTSKIKIRGVGLALQLAFAGTSGSPFKVLGWSALVSSNELP